MPRRPHEPTIVEKVMPEKVAEAPPEKVSSLVAEHVEAAMDAHDKRLARAEAREAAEATALAEKVAAAEAPVVSVVEEAPETPVEPVVETPVEPVVEEVPDAPPGRMTLLDQARADANVVRAIAADVRSGKIVLAGPWVRRGRLIRYNETTGEELCWVGAMEPFFRGQVGGTGTTDKHLSEEDCKEWCERVLKARGVLLA